MNRQTPESETARFEMNETTKVFNDQDEEVEPGSGEIGMVANGGLVPVGYFKDPEKSAKTFREIGGVRYSFPGDFATVEADGTLVLLGRGSQCINTGGEKVFPEEVEEALKAHPDVYDCLVVGVPDERFGERVTAVLSFREGADHLGEAQLADWLHGRIAGYKIPRTIIAVPEVQRAANGKADYKWAKATAQDMAQAS
jgi:fatty-acyl-CoA synthase